MKTEVTETQRSFGHEFHELTRIYFNHRWTRINTDVLTANHAKYANGIFGFGFYKDVAPAALGI
jgi:hypothetical protein